MARAASVARALPIVIKGSGHWLMEEVPGQVMPQRTNRNSKFNLPISDRFTVTPL